jgi:hypothetical protein
MSLVAISLVIGVLVLRSVVRQQQARLQELASRLSFLRVTESTFADSEQIRLLYKTEAAIDGENCSASSCKFRILLVNFLVDRRTEKPPDGRWFNLRLLRRLGIRPAAGLGVVTIKDGKVQEVRFSATYESAQDEWIWAHWSGVAQFSPVLKCESDLLSHHRSYVVRTGRSAMNSMNGPYTSAEFQSEANRRDRTRCQSIRFECLTSLSECAGDVSKRARAFMPSIYQDLVDDEAAQRADPQRYWAAERECLK